MEFQSVLKVYLMTKNGQNMAKMEKIRKMQIVDNKEDKFFYFHIISIPCTRVWVQQNRSGGCMSMPDRFLYSSVIDCSVPGCFFLKWSHATKSVRILSFLIMQNYFNPLAELNEVKIMLEKLRISLIFINLVLLKSLSLNHRMHNLYTKFVRILEICKQFSNNLVNDQGNIVRCGPVPKFSDLEVVALSLAA